MEISRSPIFFDHADYELLETVNQILEHDHIPGTLNNLLDTRLHPHGIKELGAPQSLRIAVAMMSLLGTMQRGSASDRLFALKAVRTEVLHEGSLSMRHNVARVLIRIMKRIVRTKDNPARQLALIHDFNQAASGKPRLVRKQLKKYFLYEMPEEWNQIAFDHHVHDANSKGRKTPTQLVMDAWIKGIRFLGIIYYNFINRETAEELLEAAQIMNVEVRIGVEMSARLREEHVQLVWSPMGFFNRHDFLKFLREPQVEALMEEGRRVWKHQETRILRLLERYNDSLAGELEKRYGIIAPRLSKKEFLRFVDRGQASLVHLSEHIHRMLLPELTDAAQRIRRRLKESEGTERESLKKQLDRLEHLIPERIAALLKPELLKLQEATKKAGNKQLPWLLTLEIPELLDTIEELPCRSRMILNPSGMRLCEVIETLYLGSGRITHLEIYNIKDWAKGNTKDRKEINDLRLILNTQNVVGLKRLVNLCVERNRSEGRAEENKLLLSILGELPRFLSFYRNQRLRSRMGSDSSGRSMTMSGMGLVVLPTLPWRSRRLLNAKKGRVLPLVTTPLRHTTKVFGDEEAQRRYEVSLETEKGEAGGPRGRKRVTWELASNTTTLTKRGNIAALGGKPAHAVNNLKKRSRPDKAATPPTGLPYISTPIMNSLKILLGFIPAFVTFYFTKSWWLLAWFGAVIWFSITGLRNIVQSVVGGGGLFRTSLLRWKDFVNWNRVSDSLLFTGFSVPLLDFLVKDLLLSRSMGITPASNAIALFTVMALANGIYISSHNLFRGLPLGAVVGNFFRTILSIPVAIAFNFLLFEALTLSGASHAAVDLQLFLWAAVISKFASDLVAAIIEGTADRRANLSLRMRDYRGKLRAIYANYSLMEATFPHSDLQTLMADPKKFAATLEEKNPRLLMSMYIHSLDMLYFWMYQPRGETALLKKVRHMSPEERTSLILYQRILTCKKRIAHEILEGMLGKRFDKPLAFYLSKTDHYLRAFEKAVNKLA